MRVLVDYRPALTQRTGVGEYVHELVRALTATDGPGAGDQVALFTASWKDHPLPAVAQDLPRAELIHRRLPAAGLTWMWNHLGWPPVEWLVTRCDVVHAATPVAIPSRCAPVVLTIHDLHFLRHPERMAAEMRRDFPLLVQTHARRAPAIVVSSRYTADDVERTLGVAAGRIHVCPPGAPRWAAEVRARRQREPREHILFLGTLEPRKNVGVLLDAYRQLRTGRSGVPPLVLAGGIPPSAGGWQQRAGEPGLSGWVEMRGYVDESTRRTLYARAHMLVLPSFDEGFGLPVLEAMACGVPVVVSSGGSLPEVAGSAASPLDPADVDGFQMAMAALLDPELAAAAAARGVARATAFDWARCARLARQAYAMALQEHRP